MIDFDKIDPEYQVLRSELINKLSSERKDCSRRIIEQQVMEFEKLVNLMKGMIDKGYLKHNIYEFTDMNFLTEFEKKLTTEDIFIKMDRNSFQGKLSQTFRMFKLVVQEPIQERLIKEGGEKTSHCHGYERNRKARAICIEHYKCKCYACGFDFEQHYGEIGKNFIEVHHVDPLYTIHQEHDTDPIRDLRPLCSNCHSMIHRYNPIIDVDTFKQKHFPN